MFRLQLAEQDNLADTTALMLVPTIHTMFSLVDKYYPHGDDANDGVELQHHPNKVGICVLISMARNNGSLYTLFVF